MENAAQLVPVPPPNNSGTSPATTLNKSLDDMNYYDSYSDSYDSENAIPIEPHPPTQPSHRPMRAHCAPAPPQTKQNEQNPRTYKFKARPNPFRSKKTNENDSVLTKVQIKNYINLAFQQKPINLKTEAEYECLKNEISIKRTKLASRHEYEEANKYQKALEFVSKSELNIQQYEMYAIMNQEVKEKEMNFKSSLVQFDNETKNLREELENKIMKERMELERRHKQDLDDFEMRWNGQEKNRLYNRPSNVLSALRRQLNFMLTQCRFDEAKEVQKQIDERERFEEDENYLQMQHDFNEALKKLKAKQNSEARFFEEKAHLRVVTFEQKRQRLRVGFENRAKKIKTQKNKVSDPEKAWRVTQNRRIEDGALLKKVTPSQAAISRISRNDIFEKEVVKLSLPPLSVDPIKSRKTSRNRRPMKTTKNKEKENEKI